MMKNYYKPTPRKWRKLGDSLLAVSVLAVPAEAYGYSFLAGFIFVTGVVGKFLTNFFKEETE